MEFEEFLQKKFPELVNCTGNLTVDVPWLKKFWEAATQPDKPLPTWRVLLRYNHKGLGNQFKDLGQLVGMSYEQAVQKAEQLGNACIEKEIGKDMVLGWDVKVRPDNSLR